jgi:hypothetical protein
MIDKELQLTSLTRSKSHETQQCHISCLAQKGADGWSFGIAKLVGRQFVMKLGSTMLQQQSFAMLLSR